MENRVRELLATSFHPGEFFAGVRQVNSFIDNRFLEIDLNEAAAGRLPEGASDDLRSALRDITSTKNLPILKRKAVESPSTFNTVLRETISTDQFVLGGAEHLHRLEAVIDSARSDVFLLSTFVSAQDDAKAVLGQERVWAALERACKRGVYCHLFFGSSLDKTGKHAAAMDGLRRRLTKAGPYTAQVLAHDKTAGSHVKMIVADDGAEGARMLTGSCNWLQSPFQAFEASVELRDPKVVAAGLEILRSITSALPSARHSRETMQAMQIDLKRASKRPVLTYLADSSTDEPIETEITFLSAPSHLPLLRKVAHQAKDRFVCCTDKVGAPMVSNLFDPASIAGRRLKDVRVIYTKVTGPTKKRHTREEKERLKDVVQIVTSRRPMAHAKFLLWDDDDVVVTSFNWGSQSASDDNLLDEVGIHLRGPGLALHFLSRIETDLDLEPSLG